MPAADAQAAKAFADGAQSVDALAVDAQAGKMLADDAHTGNVPGGTQVDVAQAGEVPAADARAANAQADEMSADNERTGNAPRTGTQAGDAQAGKAFAGDARTEDVPGIGTQVDDAQAGGALASNAQADDVPATDASAASAQAGEVLADDEHTGDAPSAGTQVGGVQASEVSAGDATPDGVDGGDVSAPVRPMVLPDGLEEMTPGAGLATALEPVEAGLVASGDLFTVIRAQARQLAYDQARLLEMMLEAAYAAKADAHRASQRHGVPDGPLDAVGLGRIRELDEMSGDQIAFALNRSRSSVFGDVVLAKDLIERFPDVFTRLQSGRIDVERAKAFSHCLTDLDDAKAHTVMTKLLGKAEQWTASNLRQRLNYHVHKADPGRARRRHRATVIDRRVYLRPYTDGTAELAGTNLPPDRAAAAFKRIDTLARSAKARGDVRTLGQIRADAMLDMLSGRPFRHIPSVDDVTAHADQTARFLGQHPVEEADIWALPRHRLGTLERRTHTPPGNPRGRGVITPTPRPRPTTTGPSSRYPDDVHRRQYGPDSSNGSSGEGRPNPDGSELSDRDYLGRYVLADDDPIGFASFDDPDNTPCSQDESDDDPYLTEPRPSAPARPTLSPQPAASSGPVPRSTAAMAPTSSSDTTAQTPTAEGDILVAAADDGRRCVCGGIQPPTRPGTVDIHIQLSTLIKINNNPGFIPGYGPVLAEIARQIALDPITKPRWALAVGDDTGNLIRRIPLTRRPAAAESAFVKTRDVTCRAPGCCPQPAATSDNDHRQMWSHNGPSIHENLEAACRHHHRLRHEHGYEITRLPDGTFLWRAPNGRTYRVPLNATIHLTAEDDDAALNEALQQYLTHIDHHASHQTNTERAGPAIGMNNDE